METARRGRPSRPSRPAPDAEVWAEAGLIEGTLARTQGFQRRQRKECLNDGLIYLTAAKAGLPVSAPLSGDEERC